MARGVDHLQGEKKEKEYLHWQPVTQGFLSILAIQKRSFLSHNKFDVQ